MDWGLAGYGDLSERRLVAALSSGDNRLRAVWGRDPERARSFAVRHGIERAARDPEDLCRGVDAVYIATPVSLHVPLAEAALRAGCHVLVEKPVSPGLAPAAPLLELAAGRGLAIGVAYYRRLAPALRRVRDLLAEGRFGRLLQAEIDFRVAFEPEAGDPRHWRTELAVAGGGVLADAGCHRLDLLAWLLGPPESVAARLAGFHPGGAERRAELEIAWPGGARAACRFEWSPEPGRDLFRLTLEEGEIELDPLDGGLLGNPHLPLVEDFAHAVATGRPPVCPLSEGIQVDRLIEAAYRSHGKGGGAEAVAIV